MRYIPKNDQNNKRITHIKSSWLGVLFVCLVVHSGCFGQESLSSKLDSVSEIKSKKIETIVNQYKDKKSLNWLSLAPSLNYDFATQNFNVGLSLSNFIRYKQTKKRNSIELERLRNQLVERKERELEKLALNIEALKGSIQNLKNKASLFDLEVNLFQITKGKYQNKEITTEEFLQAKISLSQKYISLQSSIFSTLLKAEKLESDIEILELKNSIVEIQVQHTQLGKNFGILRAEPLIKKATD